MYDLHCHLLPGVDDGPQSWEESLALGRALAADGVRVVAATSHTAASSKSRGVATAEVLRLADALERHLRAESIELAVVPGHEILLAPEMLAQLRGGVLLPYRGSHTVLLESPFAEISEILERAIFELQIAGYRVLLAHPERIEEVQHDPNSLLPLVQRGVLLQLTAASLLGLHGARLRATAEALLGSGMGHVLASDAHSATGKRAPCLREARRAAAALVGDQAATALVETTPQALLNNRPLGLPTPQATRPRRRFPWLRLPRRSNR